MAPRPRRPRTTRALFPPLHELLEDLRHAWSLSTATGQPCLRDYPLRPSAGDPR